jgi:membrane-associated phospholipid phosphatase
MPDGSSVEAGVHGWRRFGALWRAKLCLTVILNICFWGFYLFLSRHALFPVHRLPMTWLDKWSGFQPYPWAWIYESNFLITGLTPWLMSSREELRRYTIGFVLLSGLSFMIFALFPVVSPRPANLEEYATLLFITRVDGPLNAFPSLHAGFLVYAIALARRLFGRRLNPVLLAMLLVWGMLILYATLATKQHYALDLLAGGLLGWAADWFAWHNSGSGAIASASRRRKSGTASQAG